MKYLFAIFSIIMITSCRSQIDIIQNNLTKEENSIVNNFLDSELKNQLYKKFNGYEIVIIEDAGNGIKSLNAYEYAYSDFHLNVKNITPEDNLRLGWILDSLEIKKYREKIINIDPYVWKVTDFKNIKVKLLKFEELTKTTNNGRYLKNNLIIFLSRPLLIDKNNALLSFDIGNGDMGNYSITHFTVLMQKVDEIWAQRYYYEDGVFY
jgi:hypothetical protein